MYATVALFKVVPENHEAMLKTPEQSIEHLKNQKGFKNVIFFSDQEKNEFGAITVWETEEGYDNYLKSYSPEELEKIMSLISEEIIRDKYYVNKIYPSD